MVGIKIVIIFAPNKIKNNSNMTKEIILTKEMEKKILRDKQIVERFVEMREQNPLATKYRIAREMSKEFGLNSMTIVYVLKRNGLYL